MLFHEEVSILELVVHQWPWKVLCVRREWLVGFEFNSLKPLFYSIYGGGASWKLNFSSRSLTSDNIISFLCIIISISEEKTHFYAALNIIRVFLNMKRWVILVGACEWCFSEDFFLGENLKKKNGIWG